MSKYVKELLQKELADKFAEAGHFLVIETKGVGGNENNEMRGALKEKGIKLTVVKNALMRRALEGAGMSAAVGLFLAGPCTVASGGDSIVDVAKEIADWGKKVKAIQLKGAYVEGDIVDAEGAKALAKMPNRAQLQGTVAMLVASCGANVAATIASGGGAIAGCVSSLVEKLEKEAA
ncbi:MAG: 50S ribosomal protein L10 [Planctomycetota bacterium]|jgi:large subunit ribosomal protein L10